MPQHTPFDIPFGGAKFYQDKRKTFMKPIFGVIVLFFAVSVYSQTSTETAWRADKTATDRTATSRSILTPQLETNEVKINGISYSGILVEAVKPTIRSTDQPCRPSPIRVAGTIRRGSITGKVPD